MSEKSLLQNSTTSAAMQTQQLHKAGIGGRALEAICFPAQYEESERWEEKMRQKGGSLNGRAFCKRRVQGISTPITLAQIRQHYVPLVQEYLAAHPQQPVSERNLLRVVKRWHRQKERRIEEK
jgi:hypothetical protein